MNHSISQTMESPPRSRSKRAAGWLALLAIAVLLGICVGALSAGFAVRQIVASFQVRNGPWSTNVTAGSSGADMYTRAAIARAGLLAMTSEESVYMLASTDSSGEQLHSDCSYEIAGSDLGGYWWSITVYGEDMFLIPNRIRRFSRGQTNLERDVSGRFRIRLASTPAHDSNDTEWLPSGQQPQPISLILRVYEPPEELRSRFQQAVLPQINRTGCRS